MCQFHNVAYFLVSFINSRHRFFNRGPQKVLIVIRSYLLLPYSVSTMKSKHKKHEPPHLTAQRLRLAIAAAKHRRLHRASATIHQQLTMSPPQSTAPSRRKLTVSHSAAPSTSRSPQSVESPSPPHSITASRRLRLAPSPSVDSELLIMHFKLLISF